MQRPCPDTMLALFPAFGPAVVGGAQLSASLAWDGLREVLSASAICYGPGARASAPMHSVLVTSKFAAVRATLRRPQRPARVLIWHLGLLKLLPFARVGRAHVSLMLLGVEAWRTHDPLTRLLLRRVDQFLSISDHTWRRFLEHEPGLASKPQRTVQLGLGEPVPAPAPPVKPPAALILGRMTRGEDYKGHRELIRTWPLVRARIPHAQLWIAGDGDLRPDLERLVHEQNLGDAVQFFGHVSEAQKQQLLVDCHCFAMPSRGEGFGLVYLEAMRLGRPCLVSTLDAGREVVNPPQAGLAVDPANQAALADALAQLLTLDAVWQAWSAQARQRYASRFTAAHYQHRLRDALALQA